MGMFAAASFAQTLTLGPLPSTPTAIVPLAPSGTATTLLLPKFNAGFGTLQGVSINFVVDFGTITASYTAGTGAGLQDPTPVFSGKFTSVTVPGGYTSPSVSTPESSGTLHLTGTTQVWGGNPVFSWADDVSDISTYTGAAGETFGLSFVTDYSFIAPTVAGYTARLSDVKGDVSATVTYTFIPEPSTYAMILGAITLGLVGWRRFRR